MERLFYNPEYVGDTLFIVYDALSQTKKTVDHEGVTAIYGENGLIGVNVFHASKLFSIKEQGMIVRPSKELVEALNKVLAPLNLPLLSADGDSGYTVGEVTKLEEHPLDERCQIVSIDIGGKTLVTVSRYKNLAVGDHIVVVKDGFIKFDGTQFQAKKVRNIPVECEICSDADLRIGEEKFAAHHAENMKIGEDFF